MSDGADTTSATPRATRPALPPVVSFALAAVLIVFGAFALWQAWLVWQVERGAAYADGDYQGALTLLQTAVFHAPQEPQYHIALGRFMGRFKETARKGIEVLEKASQAFAQNPMVWYELALLYQGQGLKLRAQKAVESAQRLAPRDSRISRLAAELGVVRP